LGITSLENDLRPCAEIGFAASPAAGHTFPLQEKYQKCPQGAYPLENPLNIVFIFAPTDLDGFVGDSFVGAPDFCGYPRVLTGDFAAAPLL